MEFDVLTLFPEMLEGALSASILGRAQKAGVWSLNLHQIRDFATDKHRTTDDLPYGGGPGMVMKCEPLYGAWQFAKKRNDISARTILFSPQGKPLNQRLLEGFAANAGKERYILVCGRYEGVDERFIEECVDEEISLGDFILTGGEIAATAFIDGLVRLLPGALGNETSATTESFSALSQGQLEGPQFTRPPEFMGRKVPEILLSGDHAKIAKWRAEQAYSRTRARRPDLLNPNNPRNV